MKITILLAGFSLFSNSLWAESCGCIKNGQPINWTGDCSPAGFEAHGCDRNDGSSSGGSKGSTSGSNGALDKAVGDLGTAIGEQLGKDLLGPSDEEKEQKRQQELQAKQAEEQREAAAEAERERQDQEKLDRLKGKLKGIDGDDPGNNGGMKLKSIEEDSNDDHTSSASSGLKLKSIDDDSEGSTSASASSAPTSKSHRKEQVVSKTDGVILSKRPYGLNEDKIWIHNTNSYPVDVDVYMSIATNCNHSFADKTLQPGDFVLAGTVTRNDINADWPYTVGMNVSKHKKWGFFNYGN
jgi:hypothetical protein